MSIGLLSFNRSKQWSDRVTAAMNKSKSRDNIEKRLRKIEKEESKAAKVGNGHCMEIATCRVVFFRDSASLGPDVCIVVFVGP